MRIDVGVACTQTLERRLDPSLIPWTIAERAPDRVMKRGPCCSCNGAVRGDRRGNELRPRHRQGQAGPQQGWRIQRELRCGPMMFAELVEDEQIRNFGNRSG